MKFKIPSRKKSQALEPDDSKQKAGEPSIDLNPDDAVDVKAYEKTASRAMPVDELWNKIGFHKSLAGFYFGLLFILVDVVIGILIAGPLVNILFPYPESSGYGAYATGIFALASTLINFWFSGCWDQFVPPRRILGVKYMMRYVQFFTWMQIFQNLTFMTTIVMYTFYIAPATNLAYTGYLMLFYCLLQFPQPWSLMSSLAGSLQHYNKTSVYGFIQGQVFTRGVRYGFIFLGRLVGDAYPALGELMGMAIGNALGDFMAHLLGNFFSVFYFRKTLKKEGVTLRDFFGHEFTWPDVREILIFGIKRNAPGLINQVPSYSSFLVNLNYIPQITTLGNLVGNANTFASYINQAPTIGANVISEAYMNGKKNLTQYYIRQVLRYSVFFQCLIVPIILMVTTALPTVITYLGLVNYATLPVFIIPAIIGYIPSPYATLSNTIIAGTKHPLFASITGIISNWLGLFFNLLWIVWLQLPAKYGLTALMWILPCGQIGTTLIMITINFVYIHKKIVQIRVAKWQTFGAPFVGGLIMFLYDMALANFVMFPLISINSKIMVIPAAFITLFLAIEGFLIYFGITALIGGWDDDMINEFEKAARMSGPSKFMVIPLFKFTKWCARISKLHGKYSISPKESLQEALELYSQKLKSKP
ncbi:MAG TPA: hypothetical protein VKM55_28765 [Candidatus Lokiarchaeia archaeon]|nr:hypothetical protein [Candidatus Lokiarchaeia archaeon]